MAVAYLDHPRPVAFAHRGGAAHNPENSWPAFEYAVKLGYAYLETDARSTSDGALLSFHDATLNRITDRTGQVTKMTYKQVAAARIGGTEPIPLIEDLLGTFGDLRFNIDLKDPGTIAPLARVLKRTGAWDRVCVTSFSGSRLLAAQRILDRPVCLAVTPAAIAAVRYAGFPGRAMAARLARSGAQCAQVPRQIATREFIKRSHELGLQVHVWTLNTRDEIEHVLDLGADGVMTDDIVLLRDILTERGQWNPRAKVLPAGAEPNPGGPPAAHTRGNTPETGLEIIGRGNLDRVSSVADRDRQPPGRQQVMAERALRGTRLGATSYENDRNTDLAPRQDVPFDCPNGHHFSVPFAAEAELPPMWECRVCGAMATASTGQSPSPKKVKPPRSHWDMLMERRTVEDLEAVLAERLEVVRERRAMEGRAIADAADHAQRRSA